MKTKWFSLFKLNKFYFGNQVVTQFVFFECKYLFSIIFFYFHKTNGTQDRYHTHAFDALSIKLYSTGCATILLSGPWDKHWTELLDNGEIKQYTWGRENEEL
jgi:hypothetical protein